MEVEQNERKFTMNVGIIGLGYWGPNLLRNFVSNNESVNKIIGCDSSGQRLAKIAPHYPNVSFTDKPYEIIKNPQIDAVVIATPVNTHYELAKEALLNGKHLFIEKPFTSSVSEATELLDIANSKNLKILVDHTFIYTGAIRKIKEIYERGELGNFLYFDSVRVNLGLFQHDINVIWDLAVHDISILDYFIKYKPVSVSAFGVHHYNGLEDIAYITVMLENNVIAHIHVNWLAPVKIRMMLIGGDKKMLVFDDMEPSEKIKIYDKGVDVTTREGIYNTLIQYRTGDMHAPKIDQTEALKLVVNEFFDSINSNRNPITDGESGLRVIKILEAAQKSIKNKGNLIEI